MGLLHLARRENHDRGGSSDGATGMAAFHSEQQVTNRKHPSAGFWITVALVAVLVAYPLSVGPACWIATRIDGGENAWNIAYRPIVVALLSCSDDLYDAVEGFLLRGVPEGTHFWRYSKGLRWTEPFELETNPA
jgi:hypothetical protein